MAPLINLQANYRTLDGLVSLVSDITKSLEKRQVDIEWEHLTLQHKLHDLGGRHHIVTNLVGKIMQEIRILREPSDLPNAILLTRINRWQALKARKEADLKAYEGEMFQKVWLRLSELRPQSTYIYSSSE